MAQNFPIKKVAILISFAAFLVLAQRSNAQSATPQFMMTWEATQSSVPAGYQGKALPTIASPIVASLELVSGGKILNIKSQTIYWYLDGRLIGGGAGAQQITFSLYAGSGKTVELKAELPNYNGSFLVHTLEIPVAQPMVVASAPYPAGKFSGGIVNVKALPYFFDVPTADLIYDWSVNGVFASSSDNPDSAQINLPQGTTPGTTISIAVTAGDPTGFFTAQSTAKLTYENQL